MVFQPILGYVHHLQYKRYQAPNPYTHAHVWFGRVIVTAGTIDGLLDLLLAGQSSGLIVAYSVIAGAIWVLWIVFVISAAKKQKTARLKRNDVRMASLVHEWDGIRFCRLSQLSCYIAFPTSPYERWIAQYQSTKLYPATGDLYGRLERYQAMNVSNNDETCFFIGDLSLAWRC